MFNCIKNIFKNLINLKMEYISLGSNCSITYQLGKLGLRINSYPFDWCKITLCQLIQILKENFNDFVESLEIAKVSRTHLIIESEQFLYNNKLFSSSSSSIILTNKYKIKFAHEITIKYQLDEFKKKVTERIDRFRNLFDKKVCFVRIELNPINQSWYLNIIKLNEILSTYSSNFVLILIICSNLEYEFPSNIKIYKFNNFDPDWKMDFLDWKGIFI